MTIPLSGVISAASLYSSNNHVFHLMRLYSSSVFIMLPVNDISVSKKASGNGVEGFAPAQIASTSNYKSICSVLAWASKVSCKFWILNCSLLRDIG